MRQKVIYYTHLPGDGYIRVINLVGGRLTFRHGAVQVRLSCYVQEIQAELINGYTETAIIHCMHCPAGRT